MTNSVFVELHFWLLVFISFAAPVAIYWMLNSRRSIVRSSVLLLGLSLVAISAMDVYLLQVLATRAKLTPSTLDDSIFASEIAIALYALPVFFGGIGINVVSHLVIDHLASAEQRCDREMLARSEASTQAVKPSTNDA